MLSGLSFRSAAFVFSISSLILSGFLLTSFHLAQAPISSREQFKKKQKSLFHLPLIAKRCAAVNAELKLQYLLFRGFTFLCVQLSNNITKSLLFF